MLNRYRVKSSIGGSNPPLSASNFQVLRLRSGFRLRTPASLTPARWLKFEPPSLRQQLPGPSTPLRISPADSPLRSRPQDGSSSNPPHSATTFQVLRLRSGFRLRTPASLTPARWLKFESPSLRQQLPGPSTPLRISPADSRFAHARKMAQVRTPLSPPGLLKNPSKSITYFIFNELSLSALPTSLCKLYIF